MNNKVLINSGNINSEVLITDKHYHTKRNKCIMFFIQIRQLNIKNWLTTWHVEGILIGDVKVLKV